MALDHAQDGVRGVHQQMPAIGHLDRVRGTAARALGIGARPIARRDPDAGMPLQPSGQRVGATIGQEVHDTPPLEVAHDRSPPMAAPPCPVVDPNDAELVAGTSMFGDAVRASDEAQEGVAARRQPKPRGQSGARGAAQGEAEMALEITQTTGAATMAGGDLEERLGEDSMPAARRHAAEPPDLHSDHDGPPLPGQVVQPPRVAAMDAARGPTAHGTDRGRGTRMGQDHEAVG